MFKLQIYTTASNQLVQLYEKLMETVCTVSLQLYNMFVNFMIWKQALFVKA